MKRKKRKQTRASNVLIFLLAFVLFLLVFGGICLWAVVKINEERQQTVSSSASSTADELHFDATDARNLLIVTTDGDAAQGFVLVRADPANARIRALSIPRDTVVDYKTSETRLYELYAAQGIVVARDALATLTGLRLDNYAVISYSNIEKLIDHFEAGLIMTLSEDLNYQGEGLNIHIDSGLRTLSASQAVSVLRYPVWHGGRSQRADIQAQMVSALINQYMRESRESAADDDFSAMVNLCIKTDILRSHYNSAKAGLAYLASRNKGSLCTALSLDGAYQGSGDAIRYYTAENIQQTLRSDFV